MTTRILTTVSIQLTLIILLSAGVRMINLDQPPGDNEIFHVLAAQSWKSDGTFRVAHGIYHRNSDFTVLLSNLTDVVGNDISKARLPSVVAGALLVGALFLWVRSIAGSGAGWIAGLLMCFSPLAIGISQFVRIYSILGLVFFLGSISIYGAATKKRRGPITGLLALFGIGLLGIAFRFHLLSIIGICALVAWILLEKRSQLWSFIAEPRPLRPALAVATFIAIMMAIFLVGSIEFDRYISLFRDAPPPAAANANVFWFYHNWFAENYPLLWGALPLAAIFTISRKPSFGLFCSIILFTVLLAHSMAARKAMRYVYYLLPFFFAIWGYVLAEFFPFMRRIISDMINALTRGSTLSGSAHSIIQGFIVTAIVVFFALSNSIILPVYDLMSVDSKRGPDWIGAEKILAPWLDDDDAVILASPMQAPLFYYGRTDIEFGPKYIFESDKKKEFGVDKRTGLRAISTAESMQLVFDCYRRGLLIMDSIRWRGAGYGPGDATLAVIERNSRDLKLPKGTRLTAYAWDQSITIDKTECSLLEPVDQ